MKIALITTTIFVPEVLERYRSMGPDVTILIAGDRKTPHEKVARMAAELGNAIYYSDTDQDKLGYECSEVIGWNKIMRRNIVLLEAIRLKPDVIVTIDDDNIPIGDDYFSAVRAIFGTAYSGLMASPESKWFNIGDFLLPRVYHRGFPYSQRKKDTEISLKPVSSRKIGIAAGLWLGDPDIDAMDRIVTNPGVMHLSDLLNSGIIVANGVFTPVNSQNTAYVRELAPLMMVLTDVGRFDDIWGSYIAERVMMETDYHVHFGRPFVWQERNKQNHWVNLRDEVYGMENTDRFCRELMEVNLDKGNVFENLRQLYGCLEGLDFIPENTKRLFSAWCNDIERIL